MKENHVKEIRGLHLRYAESKNPYKVGDTITDHYHSIKIESWGLYLSLGEPELFYKGIQVDKKGNPTKKQDVYIYQSNIVTP